MGCRYVGELKYIAELSNGDRFIVPVEEGFRVLYEGIRHYMRSVVGGSLFYDYTSCEVHVAYVVEAWDDELNRCYTQKCFDRKIGSAFASCIDKHTCFDYRRA